MAYITGKEIQPFADAGLVDTQAWLDLSELSFKLKLKRGETGYSAEQIKNYTIRSHECSPAVREMILDFFKKRAGDLQKKLERL